MADSVMKWYVVRAIGGQENKVKSYIETEISRLGLSDFVSQVLVPKEKVIQIRDGKKINKETSIRRKQKHERETKHRQGQKRTDYKQQQTKYIANDHTERKSEEK